MIIAKGGMTGNGHVIGMERFFAVYVFINSSHSHQMVAVWPGIAGKIQTAIDTFIDIVTKVRMRDVTVVIVIITVVVSIGGISVISE